MAAIAKQTSPVLALIIQHGEAVARARDAREAVAAFEALCRDEGLSRSRLCILPLRRHQVSLEPAADTAFAMLAASNLRRSDEVIAFAKHIVRRNRSGVSRDQQQAIAALTKALEVLMPYLTGRLSLTEAP